MEILFLYADFVSIDVNKGKHFTVYVLFGEFTLQPMSDLYKYQDSGSHCERFGVCY